MLLRFLVVLGLFATWPLAAQDVLDRIAEESCECVDKLTDLKSEEDQAALGLCMMGKAMPHEKELKKKYDIDMTQGKEEGKRLGSLIGARMAVKCPKFFEMVKTMREKEKEELANIP